MVDWGGMDQIAESSEICGEAKNKSSKFDG